jgi:hypothetical protein
MKIKRGLVVSLSVVLVVWVIAFVSAFNYSNTVGSWESPIGTNVSGNTYTINLTQGLQSIPVLWMIVNLQTDPPLESSFEFELWEKDTQEGGGNDLLKTDITGSYDYATKEIRANSNFDPLDLVSSDGDSDGYYELIYKLGVAAYNPIPEYLYSDTVVNIHVIWPGNLVDPVLYWWGGLETGTPPSEHILGTAYVDAQDLFNADKSELSNVVYPVLDGIEIPEGGDSQSAVYFEIWADTCDSVLYPIRTGTDSISATIQKGETFATGPWYISLEDILKSPTHCVEDCYDTNNPPYYTYTFDALFANQGGICLMDPPLLDVYVDWTNFLIGNNDRWLDSDGITEISDKDLSSNDLGIDPDAKVYLEVSGLPVGEVSPDGVAMDTSGQEVYFEIYELDPDSTINNDYIAGFSDPDGLGLNDPIRTGSKALVATVDEEGIAKVSWVIDQNDIVAAGDENNYEFHFDIGFKGSNGQIIPMTHGTNLLNVGIGGELPSCDLSGASIEWRYNSPPYIPISGNTHNFKENLPNNVRPFISGLSGCENQTLIFEIFEHDTGSAKDEIRSIELDNQLFGTVNNDGEIYTVWSITEDDLARATPLSDTVTEQGEGTLDNPWGFYVRLVSGSDDVSFSDSNERLFVYTDESVCFNYNVCSDYFLEADCSSDKCGVANYTGITFNPPIECTLPGVDCGCYWDATTDACTFVYSLGPYNDVCQFSDNAGTDTCDDDGMLSFVWTAEMMWDAANDFIDEPTCLTENSGVAGSCIEDQGSWRYDPNQLLLSCQGGSNTILCPAKVQLSFWDWRNIVIVILVIIIVYLIIETKKKNANKKNKK